MTDAAILSALSDVDALTCTMIGEAGGDHKDGSSVEERIGVACAIRNRVREPRKYGDTFKAACLRRWQFSCWNVGDPNRPRLLAIAYRLVTDQPAMDPLVEESTYLAAGVVSGVLLDRVAGANHYMTRALWTSAPPAWGFLDAARTRRRPIVATVGSHVFFRL